MSATVHDGSSTSMTYPLSRPAPERERRPLRVEPPTAHGFSADDGTRLRLLRYRGGSKGPVMLVHCIGVSSLMYAIDTIETNLLEYLFAQGYDVWLLDFRFSIELPASREQSTFDDVATRDYPAAVAEVRRLAGAGSVQVVAHGVGSSTFTMAMLAGLEGVRGAVCSQVSTHLLVPLLNRMKTGLYTPSLLTALGIQSLTAYAGPDATWKDRLYDRLLRLYPVQAEERCDSAVCRRITSLYGALYEHDRLNEATHDVLHEMFGTVNLRAFRQLARISRRRHLVDRRGREAYLPYLDRLAIPMTFLHGDENDCVQPESTRITYDLLRERNGESLYSRKLIPGYGHVDCILGADAARDVYPLVLEHLEATA